MNVRRSLAAAAFLASSAALADGSGTLQETTPTLSYTSPAYVIANPVAFASGEPAACVEGAPLCDHYALTVNLSDGYRAARPDAFVDFVVNSTGDFDLHIHDAAGNEVVRSENDGGELATLDLAILPNGEYQVLLVPFIAAGDTATLDITLSGDAKSGSPLAGAVTPLAVLVLLGLAGLSLRRKVA